MQDSWDDFENQGFIGRMKLRLRIWRENRRILSEERREIQRIESGKNTFREEEFTATRGGEGKRQGGGQVFSRDRAEESVVTRMTGSEDEIGSPGVKGGFLAQWRQSAELRRQIREERKLIEAESRVGLERSKPLASPDDLGVGGKQEGSEETGLQDVLTFREAVKFLWSYAFSLRLPQWLVAITPCLAMFLGVVLPSVTEAKTRSGDRVRALAEIWPAKAEAGSWKEAEICGRRVLNSGLFGMDEDFRYFDCLLNTKDLNQALLFLRGRENRISASDLSIFRYRMADRLAQLKETDQFPLLQNFILFKYRESLNGVLQPEQEVKARQVMAGAMIVRGDFQEAVRYLEPIANSSPFVASDLLFLKFNMVPDDQLAQVQANASQLLVSLETRSTDQTWSELRNVESRLRLMMILGRETEARSWLSSLKTLDARQLNITSGELDKLSLISESRKRPIRPDVMWTRIEPLIKREPENPTWSRLALRVWADGEAVENTPIDQWVRSRLKSDSVDMNFLREGSTVSLVNGRWTEARAFYVRMIEKDPKDVAALNNLAGLLYKFPPRDLNEALRLVDRALELAPENLVILDTRGQILARMGRLDEARQILEKCLPALPKEWNLHNTIAQVYDRLNVPKNAAAHRDILQSIPKPKDVDSYAILADFLNDRPKAPLEKEPAGKKPGENPQSVPSESRKTR